MCFLNKTFLSNLIDANFEQIKNILETICCDLQTQPCVTHWHYRIKTAVTNTLRIQLLVMLKSPTLSLQQILRTIAEFHCIQIT